MIYNILIIAAVILAAAALIISLYNHCMIKEDIEGFRKEIKTLERRFDDFADARMLERKEQRHAEQKN